MSDTAADPATAPRTPRFIVDEMLGRLGRWLRILGYDTAFFQSAGAQGGPRGDQGDALLVERARTEERVLLTRDRGIRAAEGGRCCW